MTVPRQRSPQLLSRFSVLRTITALRATKNTDAQHFQFSVFSFQFSVFSFQFSVFSFQFSVGSWQLAVGEKASNHNRGFPDAVDKGRLEV
jgi:hypothetical protein